MTEILRDICLTNGCILAKVSTGEVVEGKQIPTKGILFCAAGEDPNIVLSSKGCSAAITEGPFAAHQGGDQLFGTMTQNGFTPNKEPREVPSNHPLFQD